MEFAKGIQEYIQDDKNRMCGLLLNLQLPYLQPIPPGMTFPPGPRLSTKGFRWAPRTWLSSQEIDSPDPLSLSIGGLDNNKSTRLNPLEGLEVNFPGFILHNLGHTYGKLVDCRGFSFPTNCSLSEWYLASVANDNGSPDLTTLSNCELAIITPHLPFMDLKEIA